MPAPCPPALVPFLDLLCCPVCQAPRLRPAHGALRCRVGHAFDIARHGYVSLLTGTRAISGDAAMVRARERFLADGAYEPVRRVVAALADAGIGGRSARGTIVEVGCGTGYYLAGVLDRLPGVHGLGLDSSVRALRSAARVHGRAAVVTWDVFRPFPLADGSADVVLDVFAPRNPFEFHRVLRPAGRLVVVRPTASHLAELRGSVPGTVTVDPAKERRLRHALKLYFRAFGTERVEYRLSLTETELADLVGMTPSARHLNPAGLILVPGRVTISVLATVYKRASRRQPRRTS